jgi:hypothetical protein
MKTYTKPKELIENPHYHEQKKKYLIELHEISIDAPLRDLTKRMNELPCCFTLQSCFGHFVYNGEGDTHNLKPLPRTDTIEKVEYRIAYIAFCVENSNPGRKWLKALREIKTIDPDNIQFCSAEWFWKKQVNSYALQVEPERFKDRDTVMLNHKEALRIEKIRNDFYAQLNKLFVPPQS